MQLISHAQSTVVPASPTRVATMVTWRDTAGGEPTLHALAVDTGGSEPASWIRMPFSEDSATRATVTFVDRPAPAPVRAAMSALQDAIAGAKLSGFPLVSSNADPRAGFLLIDADALRPTGHYRELPVGAVPSVDAALSTLTSTLTSLGTSEPFEL